MGVVGGSERGVIPTGLPGTAVTCCGVVEVDDALWLNVAVARLQECQERLNLEV